MAKYFLPSVDEWHKAAYYDPIADSYYDHPTGSDAPPTDIPSGVAADTPVHGLAFATGPADVGLAGGLGPNGTVGQGGNAFESEETNFDLGSHSPAAARGYRGGGWSSVAAGLLSSNRAIGLPTNELSNLGFRVATVSVPEVVPLWTLAGAGLLIDQSRRC